MKTSRLSKILAAVLLVAMLICTAASAETVSLAYGSGSLYLRKGPGKDYGTNGTVHDGDYIDVLSEGDIWSKVETDDGRTGYIKNLYISGNGDDYASGTDYFDSKFTVYTTSSANLRAGASTGTSVIKTLSKGTKLTALGENGGFYLVKTSNGTQGYVSSSLLSRKSSGSSGSGSSSTTTKKTTAYVNMREGGGMSYDIVMVVPKGAKVTMLKQGTYWTKVKYNGNVGWIKKTYLR